MFVKDESLFRPFLSFFIWLGWDWDSDRVVCMYVSAHHKLRELYGQERDGERQDKEWKNAYKMMRKMKNTYYLGKTFKQKENYYYGMEWKESKKNVKTANKLSLYKM